MTYAKCIPTFASRNWNWMSPLKQTRLSPFQDLIPGPSAFKVGIFIIVWHCLYSKNRELACHKRGCLIVFFKYVYWVDWRDRYTLWYRLYLSGNMTAATLSLWYVIQLQYMWSWINIVRVLCVCSPLYNFITSVKCPDAGTNWKSVLKLISLTLSGPSSNVFWACWMVYPWVCLFLVYPPLRPPCWLFYLLC